MLPTSRALTSHNDTALYVTEKPTRSQLQTWWRAMQHDDLSVAYADSFPSTLSDFLLEVDQGKQKLLLGLTDGEVAGAIWLHDLLHRPDGTISAGWGGCYFLASCRGHTAVQVLFAAVRYWQDMGVAHFFTAVNVANRRSQAFVTRGAAFHRVGRCQHFMLSHGQPVDVFIYTLHPEDASLAWELAKGRAARQVCCAAVAL